MTAPLRQPWTQDQFFAWASAQDGRYEFDGFAPVAMTGGNAVHSRIFGNLHFALKARLRGSACEPFGPDAGIETINGAVRYPDALVTCSRVENTARIIPSPVVVFEVVSATSGRIDRIVKVREYAAVASIRRYVILESTSVGLMVLDRATPGETWGIIVLSEGDSLLMPEIDVEIPVAEIYEGIVFANEAGDSATLPAP